MDHPQDVPPASHRVSYSTFTLGNRRLLALLVLVVTAVFSAQIYRIVRIDRLFISYSESR